MFLSKKHLVLHTITGDGENIPALKGILIDPKCRAATASDGKRLLEFSLPKVDQFPVKDLSLAGKGDEPFLLPAEDARAILQSLPEGKNPTDPCRYAAVTCARGGKISFVTSKEGKTKTHPITPIDAVFPDYRNADIFPKGSPIGSIVMDAALLRSTLGALAFADPQPITIHLFKDKLVFQAAGKDGTRVRGVQMSMTEPPPEKYSSEPKATEETPKKESAPSAAPSGGTGDSMPDPGAARQAGKPEAHQASRPQSGGTEGEASGEPSQADGRRFYGGKRRFFGKKRTFDASTLKPDVPATTGQKAFLTFLLRSRGQSLTAADLGTVSMKSAFERIETLKAAKNVDESFATFPQWKKLVFLLVEDLKMGPEKACAVLKGLSSIAETTKVIEEHLKRQSGQVSTARS